jgi:hypothetical protein
MDSKERTLTALRGEEPDRVPMYVTVVSEMAERLSQATGIPAHPCDAYSWTRLPTTVLVSAWN